MRPTTRFRRLVDAPGILVLPGIQDALTARIAEAAGFAAVTCGGYAATAALLGQPDTSQLGLMEMAEHYARICDAVSVPVFADADTGFGNVTNVRRAVRAYERAIQLRPDHARAYFNLGHAFKEKGLLQQAAAAFRRALAVEPRFLKARFMLAYVYALMDLNNEAIEQYRLTISASPSYVKAYYNLGNCYLKKGQSQQALEAYYAILELDPGHARAHFAIGQALARSGRLAEALASFQEALALKNDFPECHLAYARALEAVGRIRAALHHFRVYVNDPSAQEHRDEVLAHIANLTRSLARRESTAEVRPFREPGAEAAM